MAFEHYIHTGGKRLRCGFTTGTCAALAAAGAVRLLLTGQTPETVSLRTPKGLVVEVPLQNTSLQGQSATAAVAKDAGDDVDVTAGLLIYATVTPGEQSGVFIQGGEGVGRVTKPGLDQPVGQAAINRVPRQMIEQAVRTVCEELDVPCAFTVTISIPEGKRLAQKTFNPNLGIVDGLSVLGTSGIVEPMSQQALVESIGLELRQQAAQGAKRVLLVPGNYGVDFVRAQGWQALGVPVVKCSNFIGETLDEAALDGFEEVLLVGHAGKLLKLAGGIMNTHSRVADCRTELLCAHAAACGVDTETCCALLIAATTDACLELLRPTGKTEEVLASLMTAIDRHLRRRGGEDLTVGAVVFSNEYGLLGMTPAAKTLIQQWSNL